MTPICRCWFDQHIDTITLRDPDVPGRFSSFDIRCLNVDADGFETIRLPVRLQNIADVVELEADGRMLPFEAVLYWVRGAVLEQWGPDPAEGWTT